MKFDLRWRFSEAATRWATEGSSKLIETSPADLSRFLQRLTVTPCSSPSLFISDKCAALSGAASQKGKRGDRLFNVSL